MVRLELPMDYDTELWQVAVTFWLRKVQRFGTVDEFPLASTTQSLMRHEQ
jgi:hypothetical protein